MRDLIHSSDLLETLALVAKPTPETKVTIDLKSCNVILQIILRYGICKIQPLMHQKRNTSRSTKGSGYGILQKEE